MDIHLCTVNYYTVMDQIHYIVLDEIHYSPLDQTDGLCTSGSESDRWTTRFVR